MYSVLCLYVTSTNITTIRALQHRDAELRRYLDDSLQENARSADAWNSPAAHKDRDLPPAMPAPIASVGSGRTPGGRYDPTILRRQVSGQLARDAVRQSSLLRPTNSNLSGGKRSAKKSTASPICDAPPLQSPMLAGDAAASSAQPLQHADGVFFKAVPPSSSALVSRPGSSDGSAGSAANSACGSTAASDAESTESDARYIDLKFVTENEPSNTLSFANFLHLCRLMIERARALRSTIEEEQAPTTR
jgi:hypothetical protein